MYQVIIVIHVLLGLGVIGLVLMQQGKGADAGAAFGTGSAGSVFGAQGSASFLSRSTAILATLFFATSLGLAVANGHKNSEHDLMATPPANESGLPTVEGAKTESTPTVPDTQATPALPTEPSADTAPKADEAVKPVIEETKPAEVVKPAVAEVKKPAQAKPVEHKPASKDKKADAHAHKGKDAKKDH
jgi:preprotein translocase subunit SecG